jgi:hypothetical protein
MQLKSKDDIDIIGIQSSTVSYIDEDFFKKQFKEKKDDESDTDYFTYAVKIQCVRADWILNHNDGFKFLEEMVRLKNKNVFMRSYTKIITQYLYK